jgi:2-oxoglutarate dehydrogenase E2 component (dihydrolipoamide succinyltransferase)
VEPTIKGSSKFYSPLVKSIAKKEGIKLLELDSITGTGREGRVTKNDILNYLKNRSKDTPTSGPSKRSSSENQTQPATSFSGTSELIEMDRMRKLIAEHMVTSKKMRLMLQVLLKLM